MADDEPSSYARIALQSARVLASAEAVAPRDRAHALFTMRVFADVDAQPHPSDDPWLQSEATARAVHGAEEVQGDLCAALDAAITGAPDGAARVVLARWLVEVAS